MAQEERKIHKVPPLLRQVDNQSDAYDPKVVSFGPYHHGKEELQLCERVKPLSVQKFVHGCPKVCELDEASFKTKIMDVIADARNRYVEGSKDQYEAFFKQKIIDVIADARNCYVDGSTDQYEAFFKQKIMDVFADAWNCYVEGSTDQYEAFFKQNIMDVIADAWNCYVEGSFFKQKIIDVIADARNCYVEGSTDHYTDDQFAKMMLHDACFLIAFLGLDTPNPEYDKKVIQRTGQIVLSLVHHDVILLENQIPLSIVKLLMDLRGDTEWVKKLSIRSLMSIWGKTEPNEIQRVAVAFQRQLPHHLLEAFRIVLVWDPTLQNPPAIGNNMDVVRYSRNFRSAKDLKARGIYFKPSPNKSIKDINFVSRIFYGELQLPVWIVTEHSKVFFSNMTAYELCPENGVENIVISYLDFMKRLIESPADVKELREKNILHITLGSDEKVVKLFAEQYTPEVAFILAFQDVKRGVQEHYDRVWRTWIAEFIDTYIRNPWTVAGLLAAMLGIAVALYNAFKKK